MNTLATAVQDIIATGRFFAAKGHMPATSGNLSIRLENNIIAITASGVEKGGLTPDDVLEYDLTTGKVKGGRVPSDETALHVERYVADHEIGAIVHVHSPIAAVLSKTLAENNVHHVALEGWELLKALDHSCMSVRVPIFPNIQNIATLADLVHEGLVGSGPHYGYLIVAHGMYAWGETMFIARRRAEALEILLGYWLDQQKMRLLGLGEPT